MHPVHPPTAATRLGWQALLPRWCCWAVMVAPRPPAGSAGSIDTIAISVRGVARGPVSLRSALRAVNERNMQRYQEVAQRGEHSHHII